MIAHSITGSVLGLQCFHQTWMSGTMLTHDNIKDGSPHTRTTSLWGLSTLEVTIFFMVESMNVGLGGVSI